MTRTRVLMAAMVLGLVAATVLGLLVRARADYWKQHKKLEDKIEETYFDAWMAGSDCVIAMTAGGYGPMCRDAATRADAAIEHIREWNEAAEDLTPHAPDSGLHTLWLKYIRCRYDELKLRRDESLATEIHDVFEAADRGKRTLAKANECLPIAKEYFAQRRAFRPDLFPPPISTATVGPPT